MHSGPLTTKIYELNALFCRCLRRMAPTLQPVLATSSLKPSFQMAQRGGISLGLSWNARHLAQSPTKRDEPRHGRARLIDPSKRCARRLESRETVMPMIKMSDHTLQLIQEQALGGP